VPAKDVFHDAVKHALEKEQWIVTDDPLFLRFGGVDMYIDLAAEQLMSAERNGEKIAVEIKSFIGVSATTEFSTALGQFLKYQLALEEEQPDRVLYLAIPLDAERSFFTLELPRRLVEKYRVNLIVYEPEEEAIVRWQKQMNIDK
jgi:XisH protein